MVKEHGKIVVDLSDHGQEFLAAFGGAGGKGNRFFLSNENRAPMTATPGELGEERLFQLELRTMAHAGLVRDMVSFSRFFISRTSCSYLWLTGGVPKRG